MRKTLPPTAFVLGLSGLIPQVIACYLVFSGVEPKLGYLGGLLYAALILSFLGGLWWGVAGARDDAPAWLYIVGVCPSLVALGAVLPVLLGESHVPYAVVGGTLLMTPGVDFVLQKRGYVPRGWLAMRFILSVSLGLLTLGLGLSA